MEPIDTVLTMPKGAKNSEGIMYHHLTVDSLVMRAKPMTKEEAVVIGELQKMYERGDTLVFNTDAFVMRQPRP